MRSNSRLSGGLPGTAPLHHPPPTSRTPNESVAATLGPDEAIQRPAVRPAGHSQDGRTLARRRPARQGPERAGRVPLRPDPSSGGCDPGGHPGPLAWRTAKVPDAIARLESSSPRCPIHRLDARARDHPGNGAPAGPLRRPYPADLRPERHPKRWREVHHVPVGVSYRPRVETHRPGVEVHRCAGQRQHLIANAAAERVGEVTSRSSRRWQAVRAHCASPPRDWADGPRAGRVLRACGRPLHVGLLVEQAGHLHAHKAAASFSVESVGSC
jgi:hypothetical protein